jgi:hypothetical protein
MLNTTSLPCVLRCRHNTRTLGQPVQKARKPAPQSMDRLPPAPPAGDLEKSESTQASPTEQGQTATRATRSGLGKSLASSSVRSVRARTIAASSPIASSRSACNTQQGQQLETLDMQLQHAQHYY